MYHYLIHGLEVLPGAHATVAALVIAARVFLLVRFAQERARPAAHATPSTDVIAADEPPAGRGAIVAGSQPGSGTASGPWGKSRGVSVVLQLAQAASAVLTVLRWLHDLGWL